MVAAATEPLTERPATEFPEGITACSLSGDASGWLAGHAFRPHVADGDRPHANGVSEATSADSFVLVARCVTRSFDRQPNVAKFRNLRSVRGGGARQTVQT